ncbi:MAG: lipid kinase [Amaricoccus sp.]|uniref:lipid kinase n=1 Tax=Amaricoccus sp. TaxID=1872485 RepID=UPI0039E398E8
MSIVPGADPPRRVLMILNTRARRGAEAHDVVRQKLDAAGVAVRRVETKRPEDIAIAIREAAGEVDAVILGGGDGTISRAGVALKEAGLPLGILPLGTANDLARTLGLPLDPAEAVDVVLAGRQRRIDLGTVNGEPFFNVASLGLSSDLARELSSGLKKRWGRLGYAMAALRALWKARRFTAWITEGETTTRTRTLQIAVGNGVFYGGGTKVASDAAIDDGHLDLYSLETEDVLKLALMLRTFRSGEHGAWHEVRTARGSEFEIRTKRPKPVNADGELITRTPVAVKVHPEAVTVYVPDGVPGSSAPESGTSGGS